MILEADIDGDGQVLIIPFQIFKFALYGKFLWPTTHVLSTTTSTMILDLNSMYFYVLKLNRYFVVPQPTRYF